MNFISSQTNNHYFSNLSYNRLLLLNFLFALNFFILSLLFN